MKFDKTSKGYRFDWYHPETGERFRKVLPAKSLREARQLFEAFRKEKLGLSSRSKQSLKKTLSAAANEYLLVKSSCKRPRSQELDKEALKVFCEYVGGHFRVDQVTDVAIAKFISFCRDEKNWMASSVNRKLNTIRSLLNWAVEKRWRSEPVKVPRIKGPIRESRPLSVEDIRAVYAKAGNTLRLQILIALRCGLRRAEIATLSWKVIDFASGRVQVGGTDGFMTKSGESRIVYFSPEVIAALSVHRQQSYSPWVFNGPDPSKHIDPHNITRQWGRARAAARVSDAKFHDLRATVATRFAEQGLGDAMVASLLGHKTVAMARKYSNKLAEGQRKRAYLETAQSLRIFEDLKEPSQNVVALA